MGSLRVQQYGVLGGLCGCVQLCRIKRLARQHAAIWQAQMQQPRTVLGMVHFQWVLQDEHFDRVRYRCDPLAHAGALGPAASGANQALLS
jgi:hypothetical protein